MKGLGKAVMKAHFLQHVPFEGLGSIQNWLEWQGAELTSTRFFHHETLPDLHSLDLLPMMKLRCPGSRARNNSSAKLLRRGAPCLAFAWAHN